MPLVKLSDVVIDGRLKRQAARAAKRGDCGYSDDDGKDDASDSNHDACEAEDVSVVALIIPLQNAANFPSIECFALPYDRYNVVAESLDMGDVSSWMMQQLRRSCEFEVVSEWEAECTTLGNAELLKSIMA